MKINFREVELWLQVTVNPRFWISQKINKTWDCAIRTTLAAGHKPKLADSTMLMLNGAKLWGANYPYAYGGTYNSILHDKYKPVNNIVPTRRTRLLLRRMEKEAARMHKEELLNELSAELILGTESVLMADDGEKTKDANKLDTSILNTLSEINEKYLRDEIRKQYEMINHQRAIMQNYPPYRETNKP